MRAALGAGGDLAPFVGPQALREALQGYYAALPQ
jgi:hypothetical protein